MFLRSCFVVSRGVYVCHFLLWTTKFVTFLVFFILNYKAFLSAISWNITSLFCFSLLHKNDYFLSACFKNFAQNFKQTYDVIILTYVCVTIDFLCHFFTDDLSHFFLLSSGFIPFLIRCYIRLGQAREGGRGAVFF